ncbi:MAG TPA: hypothetical protein VM553_22670 [Dongiaceae bacterium]|nr:hypothetical protein [Dongiaceae bacterium]
MSAVIEPVAPIQSALPQRMTAEQFSAFLPHKPPMLLLETVESWNGETIECTASSHNDPANPLRINGRVSSVHAMEYGAQAAAIHLTALATSAHEAVEDLEQYSPNRIVFLGVVRDFDLLQPYLDDQPGTLLQIRSDLISIASRVFQYRVSASIGGQPYAQGIISLIVGN